MNIIKKIKKQLDTIPLHMFKEAYTILKTEKNRKERLKKLNSLSKRIQMKLDETKRIEKCNTIIVDDIRVDGNKQSELTEDEKEKIMKWMRMTGLNNRRKDV